MSERPAAPAVSAPPPVIAPPAVAPGGGATAVPDAMSAVEWSMLLGLSVIWGGSFFFNKILLGAMAPLSVMLGRAGFAAIALLLYLYLSGGALPRSLAMWRAFLVMSVFNNLIPFSLILWGQQFIGVGHAAILNATTPLFAALLGHALGQERMSARRLLGVGVGLAGVVVMVGPDVLLRGFGSEALAQFAVLAAAVGYGIAAIYGRRYSKLGLTPRMAAAGQLLVTTLIGIPLVAIVDQPWNLPMPGVEHWITMAALALVSTAFGYIIYFRLLSGAGAVNTSLVTMLVPVSALLLGIVFLGEVLTLRQAAGMAVILLGLLIVDGRFFRRRRPFSGVS
jgi:drug/metabolite transporter (DMT)-like permease